jgi:ribose 5-phosphate isomerase B
MTDEQKIRDMVRRVVMRTVGELPSAPPELRRGLVTELELEGVPEGGELAIPEGALVTPLARQAALERKITLVSSAPAHGRATVAARSAGESKAGLKTVAVGADHGGFRIKEQIAAQLANSGYRVIDCGTYDEESADYPDFALAVAQLVARGEAWRGILIDGAGIGSCMAANKVPGVRAAMCYDQATARNSREHNDANVLTLGAGMVGPALIFEIVTSWLEAPSASGRHARRVDKIMDIERRFLRQG